MKKKTSKNHKIYAQDSNKISLSCYDDKRDILENGIDTLPFGHKNLLNNI